jgi:hypothetical protein
MNEHHRNAGTAAESLDSQATRCTLDEAHVRPEGSEPARPTATSSGPC